MKSMIPEELHSQILDYSNLNTLTNSDSMEKLLKYTNIYYNKSSKNIDNLIAINESTQINTIEYNDNNGYGYYWVYDRVIEEG